MQSHLQAARSACVHVVDEAGSIWLQRLGGKWHQCMHAWQMQRTGLHEARRKVATQQYEANQVISHARCSMPLEGVAGLALGQQQLQR